MFGRMCGRLFIFFFDVFCDIMGTYSKVGIMKSLVSFVAMCLIVTSASAIAPAGQGRRTMAAQMAPASQRATASTNQLSAMASMSVSANNPTATITNDKSSVRVEETVATIPTPVDTREKEKKACISNNIGVGNTFVWASRYSNVNNYASMVEDTESPENNTCFVKVELRSDDSRISVADVPAQYYEMGRDITCGAWADEGTLKKRILDAKKSARTWGTVAGVVGGAGLGVGIMELFGNKLIGGSVQGQKALKDEELIRSQLLAIKGDAKYKSFIDHVRALKRECESEVWADAANKKPDACNFDYNYLLSIDATNS